MNQNIEEMESLKAITDRFSTSSLLSTCSVRGCHCPLFTRALLSWLHVWLDELLGILRSIEIEITASTNLKWADHKMLIIELVGPLKENIFMQS
jgi:hypothetical protein